MSTLAFGMGFGGVMVTNGSGSDTNWLIYNGTWNDSGVWDDTANWED